MGAALVSNIFPPIPSKFSFHMKKKWLVAARYLQSIKLETFLTVQLSQYSKSGGTFSSSEPVVANSDCSRLGKTLYLGLSVQGRPTHLSCAGAWPQELGHWLCSQILRLSSWTVLGSDWQTTALVGRGLNLDSNLNSAVWPMGCRGFICFETPK